MSDSHRTGNGGESAADRALREGLRAPALSADAMQRIRVATEQEWRAALDAAPANSATRRHWLFFAAAVAASTIAVVSWNAVTPDNAAGAVLGQIARSDAPGIVESRAFGREVALMPGTALRTGRSLEIRGDSLVALVGGGNLRVTRASAITAISANVVRLDHGELYVDIPPGSRGSVSFIVATRAGEFRHVGTQFAVAIVDGLTRLRVREGSVQWHASEGDSTVPAGTEVVIEGNRAVSRHPIATMGRDWAWAESMAPDFEIENRPLSDFLEWFARETGRTLVMADDSVRKQAEAIRMHGSVRGLTMIEALSVVMSATTLRFELPEGAIRVSSARESAIPSN
jgi:ferric-dicitrate binding protein FerR (iron transport regulator)